MSLGEAWEREAAQWITWARARGDMLNAVAETDACSCPVLARASPSSIR